MIKCFSLLIVLLIPISSMGYETNKVFKAKEYKKPLREYSIIASEQGYFPRKIFAYVGEKVRFFVTASSDKSQCFLIKDHSVFLSAKKGKVSEGEVSFFTPGRFEFYCPSTSFKGYITVIQKEEDKKTDTKREIASEKPNYWIPRDYD